MKKYIVSKILNNSVIECYCESESQQCIAQGKGLAFKVKVGDQISDEDVESMYFRHDHKSRNEYIHLIERCDSILIEAVEEVIQKMELQFGKNYDEYIHLALLDHLNFSLYRLENNIEVNNILIDEYRLLYAKEYEFAKKIVEFINQKMHVKLPESEVGFLTLHFHSALHNERVSKSSLYMEIIGACLMLIEQQLNIKMDHGSIQRMRLITHLKFALQRVDQNIEIVNPVLESLKNSYRDIYDIAVQISLMLKNEYGIHLPNGELGYLVLHIQNIVMTLK